MGDAEAVGALLADDVVFHSPLTDRLTFRGRDEVVALHRDIFAALKGISTGEPLRYGDTQAFSFRAKVRGVDLEAMNLVRRRGPLVGALVACLATPLALAYRAADRLAPKFL